MEFGKCFVTGAAGFIGSHLCDALLAGGAEVVGFDDLSAGKLENLEQARRMGGKKFAFVRGNILQAEALEPAMAGAQTVFHLAADPRVKESAEKPQQCFDQNIVGTFRVLEAARKCGAKHVMLASTSTVYGDAKKIPTPESEEMWPISNYGASKVVGENYLAAYAHAYGMRGTALRYANIYGERSDHGVMRDFVLKLRERPEAMEILGDGKQDKSYLHVSDCVKATLLACAKQKGVYDYFNVGSREKHIVDEIALMIAKEMGAKPKLAHTGGKRGWVGDVNVMLLDTKKIGKLGWKETVPFEKGVRAYVRWLQQENAKEKKA